MVNRRLSNGMRWMRFWRYLKNNYQMYLLLLPGVVFIFIFCYVPMYGIQIAFKDFFLPQGHHWQQLGRHGALYPLCYILQFLASAAQHAGHQRVFAGCRVPHAHPARIHAQRAALGKIQKMRANDHVYPALHFRHRHLFHDDAVYGPHKRRIQPHHCGIRRRTRGPSLPSPSISKRFTCSAGFGRAQAGDRSSIWPR